MLLWFSLFLIILAVVFIAPELFAQGIFTFSRKMLKKLRESYLGEKGGYERMIKEVGPKQWWEEEPETKPEQK